MGYWGNRKPPFGTRINPDHPLSAGLVAFWPFNERIGAAHDIVRSGEARLAQTTGVNPWLGDYHVLKAFADGASTAAITLPTYLRLQPSLSLVWQGIHQVATTANAIIFGFVYSNPNVAPSFTYALTTDAGNGINFDRNDAGTRRTLLSGIAGNASLGAKRQWVCTLTTGAAAMYINSLAKNAGGSAAGSASITYNSTGYLAMNGASWTEFGAMYNRVIPVEQMDWMRVEPFDHFESPSFNIATFPSLAFGGGPLLAAS